jgi:hypothetical protein
VEKVERCAWYIRVSARLRSLTRTAGSRKGRRKASPQDPARQHPGHHQARHPSSRSSRWRQAYLRSDLRRDPWCSQDLFGECSSLRLPITPTRLLTSSVRSSVIRSHTPSTPSERPSPLSTSSMPSSGQDALSTVSVLRFYFHFAFVCICMINVSLFYSGQCYPCVSAYLVSGSETAKSDPPVLPLSTSPVFNVHVRN